MIQTLVSSTAEVFRILLGTSGSTSGTENRTIANPPSSVQPVTILDPRSLRCSESTTFCYETVAIHVVKDSAKDLSFYIPFLRNFLRNIWEGLPTTDVTLCWQWMTCCRSTWVPFRASPRLQPVWKFRLQKLRNESCCYPVARWWWTPLSATSTQEAPTKISLSVPPSFILLMSTSNSNTWPVYSCGALRLPWRGVCLLPWFSSCGPATQAWLSCDSE